PVHVPEPLRPGGVLQRLVLGQHVDESFAKVVTVPAESLPAGVAERGDDLPDLAGRAEAVRHSSAAERAWGAPAAAAVRVSSAQRCGRARAWGRPGARRPDRSARGARSPPPGPAR